MSKECLDLIIPYLDAANIDIKTLDKQIFQKYVGASDPKFIEESCKYFKKHKIHLEITTLLIPTINDSKVELTKIANFIAKNLGKDTPWHISRYFPCYKMTEPATTLEKMKLAAKIGKAAGLKYVYLGNI
ncbi:MAG: hypothetical protein M1338_04305 [Patescibacteria group bacterium]|nr:hypothetical protein [Patescibacteria group bacterium]